MSNTLSSVRVVAVTIVVGLYKEFIVEALVVEV
jgi:hypothetical protein